MDGKQASDLLLRLNITESTLSRWGIIEAHECILMRWSYDFHHVVNYGYGLDIGNTVGLVIL